MGLGPPEGAYENPHRPVGSQEVLTGRLSAPGAPATDEKRRGAAFPGGRARGVFPRRLIGGSDRISGCPRVGRSARPSLAKTWIFAQFAGAGRGGRPRAVIHRDGSAIRRNRVPGPPRSRNFTSEGERGTP